MRKRKVFRVLLSMLLMTCMLSACSGPNLPFLNKDKEEQPSEGDTPTQEPKIITKDGLTFHVGDVITFDDLASLSAEDEGNALQKVIMQSDGTTIEEYALTESGIFSVYVAASFLDGASENAECVIEVLEQESNLPEELQNSIATKNWSTGKLYVCTGQSGQYGYEYDEGDDYSVSYSDSVSDRIQIESTVTSGGLTITPVFISNSVYNQIISSDANIFAHDLYSAALMESIAGMFGAEDEEVRQLIGWYGSLLSEITNATIIQSGAYLYDTDGNSYQVMIVGYGIDASEYNGPTASYARYAYVDYDDGKILFTLESGDPASAGSGNISVDTGEEEEQDAPTTYEEFKELAASSFIAEDWAYVDVQLQTKTVEDAMKDISNDFIIGNVTPLLPSAPPDAEVVADPEGTSEPEESGVVADIFVPYSAQHPEIYTWPENATQYSRWVYVIDSTTQFVSTIINPDGTVVISGDVKNQDWRLDLGTGESTTPGQSSGGMIDEKKLNLTSSYGAYEVSTAGLQGSSFDEDNSTAGRVIIKQGTNTYYIETVRLTQIQSYMANCLYGTNGFKDGYFRVVAGDKVTGTNGDITPYTIQYTDNNNNGQTSAYMAVYNINNDYLCCYGSQMPGDNATFVNILNNMVRVK